MSEPVSSMQGAVNEALTHARLVSDFIAVERLKAVHAVIESRIDPDPVGFVTVTRVNAMLREIIEEIHKLP